jgi:predicted transcriptional regulator
VSIVKYRSRLEIIVDVLNTATNGASKTRIMYAANLSYKLLEKYIKETIESGFMSSGHRGYEVTEKGKTFLEKYGDFSASYSRIEDQLKKILLEREALERMCESTKRGNSRHSAVRGNPS